MQHDILCPVTGDKIGEIGLPDDASPQQIAAALARTASMRKAGSKTAAETARDRKAAADRWWAEQERQGITVNGITLAISANDVAMLHAGLGLAERSVALGLVPADTTFAVLDLGGQVHQLTVAQMTALLLSYGQQRQALVAQYAQRIGG